MDRTFSRSAASFTICSKKSGWGAPLKRFREGWVGAVVGALSNVNFSLFQAVSVQVLVVSQTDHIAAWFDQSRRSLDQLLLAERFG